MYTSKCFQPYLGGLTDLWASLPIGFDWAVAVTGCSNVPTIGQELLLDYWHTKPVIVVPVPCGGPQLITDLRLPTQKFASLYVLRRNATLTPNQLLNEQPVDRAEALRMVKAFFTPFGVSGKMKLPFLPFSPSLLVVNYHALHQGNSSWRSPRMNLMTCRRIPSRK